MVKLLLSLLPFLLVAAACETTAARRAPVDPSLPPLQQGRIIYEDSCSRCHALYMPASYHADEWGFFVRKYGRKARLSEAERGLVARYLEANARR